MSLLYPLTAGLTNKRVRAMMAEALPRLPDLPEWCDAAFVRQEKWLSWRETIEALHAPQSGLELEASSRIRHHLAYDELLANQLAIALIRQQQPPTGGRQKPGG